MLLMMLAGWEANRAAYLQAPQPPKMQYWYNNYINTVHYRSAISMDLKTYVWSCKNEQAELKY
jgi:hypothetical protein